LVEEAGKPCASGRRGGGSYARIGEAQKELEAQGIVLSFVTLRSMRDTAYAFRNAPRRDHSFAVYQAAMNPDVLAAVIKSLPSGTPITSWHFRAFRRAAAQPGRAPAPRSIARLAKTLLSECRAARIATVAGLMEILGISAEDFAPDPLRAARPVQPASPAAVTA
jgi:hypothetical protein